MKYRVAVIAAPILILAACEPGNNDPGSAEECIEAFAAADGYGYEQDGYDCAQPPPGDDDDDDLQGEDDCDPPTPETVADEAAGEGVAVDPAAFITRDAALCIAELAELDDGLEGYQAWLVFNHDEQRPCWAVQNVLYDEQFEGGGEVLLIDALTGEILFDGEWNWIA
ncbi:MAG: hypothetical protein QGH45_00140 [Myxococcota bacterium]|nr:hypothetical protein [Myxococcota bacterium]